VLLVRDVPASLAYWRDKLGFGKPSTFGEPPEFAILSRGDARVMLGKAKAGLEITPFWKQRSGLCNAYFWVDDARAMFAEIKGNSAVIEYDLELQDYGVLEFGVRDPDDQVVSFGEIVG
jgi:catechol 2,3-dioxygenase-like lactoylglutathione lyase family enzyme